jgi:hypothetical protein
MIAIAAASLVGCGGDCRVLLTGGLVVGCGDEPPGPGDPAFGTAAEVLLKDCDSNRLLWVGIDAPPTPTPTPGGSGGSAAQEEDVFAEFEALRCAGQLNWIGGTVVVANDHPNGFFFDPAEIIVFAEAPPQSQTTIAAIAEDPVFFAPDGGGGRLQWVVPAAVLDIETSEPIVCPVAPVCTSSSP